MGAGVTGGATRAAAAVFGLPAFCGLASGTFAAAGTVEGGAVDTSINNAGSVATGGSSPALPALCNGSEAVTSGGRSTTRRSGTSTRRTCQGKPTPGSPRPSVPKVRVNSSRWTASEKRRESGSRLRSASTRWPSRHTGATAFGRAAAIRDAPGLGAAGGPGEALKPGELKRAPPSLPGRSCWRG